MSVAIEQLHKAVEERIEETLDAVIEDLAVGRPDVAITNLTHALQIATGFDEETGRFDVPRSIRGRLDQIVRDGGGFR